MTETQRRDIEAAIAFGRSDDWIKRRLDATDADLASVRSSWAELLALDPWFQQQAAGIAS